jgi:hypothetical protein
MAGRQRDDLSTLVREERVGADDECTGAELDKVSKAESISFAVLAGRICSCSPRERTASCRFLVSDSVAAGSAGLTSRAMTAALGTNSCNSPSRFAASSAVRIATPVMLPPG